MQRWRTLFKKVSDSLTELGKCKSNVIFIISKNSGMTGVFFCSELNPLSRNKTHLPNWDNNPYWKNSIIHTHLSI